MRFAINIDVTRLAPEKSVAQVLDEALEIAIIADQSGFDILFVAEHHTIELAIGPNPFVQLASWISHITRARMGPAVIAVPYWHPVRLAEEAALFDLLSGGRLELGLGRGAYQYEFDRMGAGITADRAREMLGEMVPLVKDLWAGKEVAYDQAPWVFPETVACPAPLQSPRPPIWIAARHPDSFDFAVREGCDVMVNPLAQPFSEVESLFERMNASVQRFDAARPRMLVLRNTAVYDEKSQWMEPVNHYYEFSRHFQTLFLNSGGVSHGFAEPADLSAITGRENYEPEAISRNHVFGTPSEVIEKLRGYEAVGVDYFLYAISPGTPHEFAMRSLRLFADEVMPAFQTD